MYVLCGAKDGEISYCSVRAMMIMKLHHGRDILPNHFRRHHKQMQSRLLRPLTCLLLAEAIPAIAADKSDKKTKNSGI
jgi:hypothetical protein